MTNLLLEQAAHQQPARTRRGALERLFTLMFQGFVYNQIWEDPEIDLEALGLQPHHRLITIASGGCNVLNYLAANPASIDAVDLNDNHIAPLFDSKSVRLLSKSPVSLYALGIPPAQYDELVSSGEAAIAVLRQRVERLACDFPIQENYFAWQAFGRGYDVEKRAALPAY